MKVSVKVDIKVNVAWCLAAVTPLLTMIANRLMS